MRIAGWPRALNAHLIETQERYRRNGFEWGRLDCVHFAGNWARILTGVDHLADYRGTYNTREAAMAELASRDGTLLDALTKRLGAPVHPAQAMRGDIAYREADEACGIYFTSGARMCALFLGEGGFVMRRFDDTSHAFRLE